MTTDLKAAAAFADNVPGKLVLPVNSMEIFNKTLHDSVELLALTIGHKRLPLVSMKITSEFHSNYGGNDRAIPVEYIPTALYKEGIINDATKNFLTELVARKKTEIIFSGHSYNDMEDRHYRDIVNIKDFSDRLKGDSTLTPDFQRKYIDKETFSDTARAALAEAHLAEILYVLCNLSGRPFIKEFKDVMNTEIPYEIFKLNAPDEAKNNITELVNKRALQCGITLTERPLDSAIIIGAKQYRDDKSKEQSLREISEIVTKAIENGVFTDFLNNVSPSSAEKPSNYKKTDGLGQPKESGVLIQLTYDHKAGNKPHKLIIEFYKETPSLTIPPSADTKEDWTKQEHLADKIYNFLQTKKELGYTSPDTDQPLDKWFYKFEISSKNIDGFRGLINEISDSVYVSSIQNKASKSKEAPISDVPMRQVINILGDFHKNSLKKGVN